MTRRGFASVALAVIAAIGTPAAAKVFLTVDEALKLAFPGAQVARRTAYLKEDELARARKLAGTEVASALVTYHAATKEGKPAGTAYFDHHRVRTLPETVMVIVDLRGRVARVEVLEFNEPEQYLPRGAWYGQFAGRGLDAELDLARGIRPIAGATLTARATTAAVRRVLALHQVLAEREAHPPDARPDSGERH
jgi:Na+-translocating ferredoxin:NAD+ oxidoreductase RnfG subunit